MQNCPKFNLTEHFFSISYFFTCKGPEFPYFIWKDPKFGPYLWSIIFFIGEYEKVPWIYRTMYKKFHEMVQNLYLLWWISKIFSNNAQKLLKILHMKCFKIYTAELIFINACKKVQDFIRPDTKRSKVFNMK